MESDEGGLHELATCHEHQAAMVFWLPAEIDCQRHACADERVYLSTNARHAIEHSKTQFGGAILALLALAIFINYVDRGNLATAAPLIKSDLQLTNVQYGLLVSAFFWIYVPGQIMASWLIQKINAYRTLTIGLAIWSAATIASGFASGFATLMLFRVFLGIGESAGFPASSKLLAQHLAAERLGKANGLVSSGIYLGPAFGTFAGGLLIAYAGWRLLFIGFGALSLLWLIPWKLQTRALSGKAQAAGSTAEPPFRELLSNRQLWGASIGHFCSNYPFYMVLSWLPLYLVKSQGYSITAMAQLCGVVYALAAMVCFGSGWLADRWIAGGANTSRVRLAMMSTVHLIWVLCMAACGLGSARMAIAGLVASSVAMGLGGCNLYTIGQTLAGPQASGKWIGVQNAIGNLAGILAPVVTGALIDWTGRYSVAFLVTGAVSICGAGAWLLLVRQVAPIVWTARNAVTSPAQDLSLAQMPGEG
jgi:MFS family permease